MFLIGTVTCEHLDLIVRRWGCELDVALEHLLDASRRVCRKLGSDVAGDDDRVALVSSEICESMLDGFVAVARNHLQVVPWQLI